MASLSQASESLDTARDSSMLVLQRGLILLKTHLEAFRKRYSSKLKIHIFCCEIQLDLKDKVQICI